MSANVFMMLPAAALEPVVNGLCITAGRDDAGGSELGEMLGQRRLRDANRIHELADRAFALINAHRIASLCSLASAVRRRAASAALVVEFARVADS